MAEEVLFQITKEHLETGLRGFPVGYCTTSTVHPEKGLFYRDRSIDQLADWAPESVIFLLYYGYEGKPQEVEVFKQELKNRARLSKEVIEHIEKLPRKGHPMAIYASALMILGIFEGKNDYREDCLNLIAKIPEVTATVINYHAGWGKTPQSRPELGYMENFAKMLNIPNRVDGQKLDQLTNVLTLFNILHYDHGGGNLSTFVGKAVASGLADMYGSLAASMNALAGPRHGLANQECLHFVLDVLDTLGEEATEQEVEHHIREKLNKKELIYGFGHAVLRVEDPRAIVLYRVAQKYYPDSQLIKMALMIRNAGTRVLKENPKIADPYPNVDAISGSLLTAAGFPYPDYYTVLFGLSRTVGISMQIVYERLYAREGKGTPIVRPKYLFKTLKN